MKKLIQKMRVSITLALSLLFLVTSCNQIETPEPSLNTEEFATSSIENINEEDLIELSAVFASLLANPEVLNEFFSYSKIFGNEGELEFSLKKVFETEYDQISRKKSSIVSAFKEQDESLRYQDGGFDAEYFIDFMKNNDIEVLAPYLARNFSLEDIDELTISWWTQEMEDEGLLKDPNWKGETPAFKIKLANNRTFESIIEAIKGEDLDIFMVSDEYAMLNPTIVFGAFREGLYDRSFKQNESSLNNENLNYLNVVPSNVGINCNLVLPNDVVRYTMPALKILDNTKGWPSGNYITVWLAFGAYNINQGGLPSLGFNVNRLVHEKKINRGDFAWKTDFIGQPLLTHWHESNVSIQIITAYQRNNHTFSQSVTSTSVNPTTGATTTSTQTVSQHDTMSFGSQHWFRCQEINGAHKITTGHGLWGGNAIWQMTGRDGRLQFTLEPRLTRL